ncbi:MAG: lipoyl(octanoyl) transferase LipB [Gemmatimonadota bacterium]
MPDALTQDLTDGSHTGRLLLVCDLGLLDYDAAYAIQKDVARRRIAGEVDQDVLLLVEHPPVVTLGRGTKPGNLLVTPDFLLSRGIQLRDIDRGGDVTVHEPGQLVAYPIVDLKRHKQDLHWYLRQVEESVMGALASFGLDSGRVPGRTGVWREGRKLASIGVHAREWVTWHGVALNVSNDLDTFAHVVPCGIDQVEMTTVLRECSVAGIVAPGMAGVRDALAEAMADVFSLTPISVTSAPTNPYST